MPINIALNVVNNINKEFKDIEKQADETSTKASKSFKKMGVAIGLAGVAIGVGVRKLFDYTKQYSKLEQQVKTTFGTQGKLLRDQISLIQSMASTYDGDFNSVLKASNVLAKEFGIDSSVSLDLVKQGFEKGANSGGEFLEMLKEYPAQLRAVNLNAEETIALISQQVETGVFSDKGIDSIKEAGLRLREMNKGTSEAIGFLGVQRAEEINLAIAKGDTFKAIQLVSAGLDETKLTAKETQLIISDVFGGAGEDAGLRYLKTLKDVNLELDDLETTASDFTIAQGNLTTEWNKFSNSVVTGSGKISKAFATVMNEGSDMLKWLRQWNDGLTLGESMRKIVQEEKGILQKNVETFKQRQRFGIEALIEGGMTPEEAIRERANLGGGKYIKETEKALEYIKTIANLEKELKSPNRRSNIKSDLMDLREKLAYERKVQSPLQLEAFKEIAFEALGVDPTVRYDKKKEEEKKEEEKKEKNKSLNNMAKQNKVSQITINVDKMVETINVTSSENIQNLKLQFQKLLTEVLVDANAFGY